MKFVWLSLIATLCFAADLETVIQKHVEARGGFDAWSKIKTVRMKGTYTAFSEVSDFSLIRKANKKYHLDCEMNGLKVTVGHDGEDFWWINHFFGKSAQPLSGPDLMVFKREIDFATPLFDYADRGFEAKLIGETTFEGMPAIAIELKRGEEETETWYLDPETYLEFGFSGTGSDFGRPVPQTSFFSDFREVEGVMMPFLVESQFYTRDRVMEVAEIEVNVDVPDAIFAQPLPIGMEELKHMAGSWHVKVENSGRPGAPFRESERTSQIDFEVGRTLLRETYTNDGVEAMRTFSFDPFREIYRFTGIDSREGMHNIMEGKLGEDGKITVDNLGTKTSRDAFGQVLWFKVSVYDLSEAGFKLDVELSNDDGETWFLTQKNTYTVPEEKQD